MSASFNTAPEAAIVADEDPPTLGDLEAATQEEPPAKVCAIDGCNAPVKPPCKKYCPLHTTGGKGSKGSKKVPADGAAADGDTIKTVSKLAIWLQLKSQKFWGVLSDIPKMFTLLREVKAEQKEQTAMLRELLVASKKSRSKKAKDSNGDAQTQLVELNV
jgi:hypothetical protein